MQFERPPNEPQRLEALRRRDILDTPAEEAFDRIVRLAAQVSGAPRAAITLVDEGRTWFKSRLGSDLPTVLDRETSFSARVILSNEMLIVEDATRDPRFRNHPMVSGEPHLRFFAGAPIVTHDGFIIGSLCLAGSEPRGMSAAECDALVDLAALVAYHIEARVQRESDIARRQQLEAFVRFSHDAAMITDLSPTGAPVVSYVNEAFERLTGYARSEVIGRSPELLHGPDTDPVVLERLRQALKHGQRVDTELVNYGKNGEPYWVELSITPVFGEGPRPISFVGIQRDVTVRRVADEIARRRNAVLELTTADAPLEEVLQGMVELFEFGNPGTIASILFVREGRLFHAASGKALPEAYWSAIDGTRIGPAVGSCGTAAYLRQTVISSDIATDPRWNDYRQFAMPHGLAACWSSPILSRGGETLGTLALYTREPREPTTRELQSLHEATRFTGLAMERRLDRENLERMALYDTLTDLPNRALFEKTLHRWVEQAAADGTKLALGMIDLDRFKVVNDSLGHDAGDQLLVEVSRRLTRIVRASDMIARVGGDEFVIVMRSIDSSAAAEELGRRAIAQIDGAFHPSGSEVFVRASMGVAVFPDDGATAGQLLRLADRAMYAAKAKGGGVSVLEHGERQPEVTRVALEAALSHAIDKHELSLVYQVQRDLATRSVCGAEALLRWRHPEFGRTPTIEVIRIAEETGLIVPIGAWVLDEACRVAARWQESGGPGFVSVNVSARQFEDRGFVDTVGEALSRARLEPHRLHLEVTEGLVMRAPETAVAVLHSLKRLGVKIVVDDFGSGYSSLNYLKRFPLDALKIDQAFVRDVGTATQTTHDESIVRAIIALASALGLNTIAEGIELEAQADFLQRLACSMGQGYALGRPTSALALENPVTTSAAFAASAESR